MYPNLFKPLELGGLFLKNRIMMAPLYVGYANSDGTVSRETIAHYAARARGGAAVIVVEATAVSINGSGSGNNLKVYDDKFLPGLSALARAIKENGALACLQIFHAGKYAKTSPPLSASSIPFNPIPSITITPREMSLPEIETVVEHFSSSAARVKEAGFDMVEILGSTGYLITQFLSPLTNIRTDLYGGSPDNRLRFPLEILTAVKKATGGDFPIGMRFMGDDFLPGGFAVDDARLFAGKLDREGIAYLSITGGVFESWRIPEIQKKLKEKGGLIYLAREIRDCVGVPVFAGNRVCTPDIAEEVIGSGQADGVALGRPLLRDPYFPLKAANGRDINECISCFGCIGLLRKGKKVFCVQEEKPPHNSNGY